MQRVYFPINEELAKQAHNMMSFRDYVPGSVTAEYKRYVDNAYDLAEKVMEERPESTEKANALAEKYAKKMADNFNARSRIGCMCPSVMISGAGNFPVKKKEKQNAASDKNFQEWNEIQGIIKRIESLLNGKDIILSGEADALGKLQAKLDNLKKNQEKMKEANKAIRMKDEEKGNLKLAEMGYTEAQIKELRTPDFCGRVGYPSYMLTNNNSNIRRIEGRIKNLEKEKGQGQKESENDLFKTVENSEIMRLQLFFEGKPDTDTRTVLKKHGFRWSPKNGCWQRQLNDNARYALKSIKKELGV